MEELLAEVYAYKCTSVALVDGCMNYFSHFTLYLFNVFASLRQGIGEHISEKVNFAL